MTCIDGEQAINRRRLQGRSQLRADDGGFKRESRQGHAEVLAGVQQRKGCKNEDYALNFTQTRISPAENFPAFRRLNVQTLKLPASPSCHCPCTSISVCLSSDLRWRRGDNSTWIFAPSAESDNDIGISSGVCSNKRTFKLLPAARRTSCKKTA